MGAGASSSTLRKDRRDGAGIRKYAYFLGILSLEWTLGSSRVQMRAKRAQKTIGPASCMHGTEEERGGRVESQGCFVPALHPAASPKPRTQGVINMPVCWLLYLAYFHRVPTTCCRNSMQPSSPSQLGRRGSEAGFTFDSEGIREF